MPTGLMKLPDGTIGSAHPSAATLAIDATTMRIRSVITTSQPDRAGDVVVPTGIRNIEEFLMNPVGLRALAYIKIDALTWRIPGAISRNAPS